MNASEADVREELASPLLVMLGYKRGTLNDILREFPLAYDRFFLGRKKKNDPPLRGRADYILSVVGAARWVLEVKAASEPIDRDAIEQAISYARHPEISAVYAAIFNGIKFVLFHTSQSSLNQPLVDLNVTSLEVLVEQLRGVLAPSAIRRDCSPPAVDLKAPLAEGFRSSADVKGGVITYSHFSWESNFPMPEQQKLALDQMCERMLHLRSNILGGKIWRDETSRVRAKLDWNIPYEEMLKFVQDKRLLDIEYISLAQSISVDPAAPTMFDFVGNVQVSRGELLFNMLQWETRVADIDMSMNYRGQVTGYMHGNGFIGTFQSEYESLFPALPRFGIGRFAEGPVEGVVAPP